MTTQPAAQVQPIEVPPLTPIVVLAHLLQNTLGALGLTALCLGLAWAAGVKFESYRWPGILGLCWWGLINWWRFSEEGRAAIRAKYWKAQYEALDKENDALDALLLERDRRIARQDIQLANRKNFVTSRPDRLSPTLNDAISLVLWKYRDGHEITQRWAQKEKAWSTKRYGDAMQILSAAHIVGGKGNAIEWAKYDSPAVALIALDGITLDDSILESNQSSNGEGE